MKINAKVIMGIGFIGVCLLGSILIYAHKQEPAGVTTHVAVKPDLTASLQGKWRERQNPGSRSYALITNDLFEFYDYSAQDTQPVVTSHRFTLGQSEKVDESSDLRWANVVFRDLKNKYHYVLSMVSPNDLILELDPSQTNQVLWGRPVLFLTKSMK
jgi:hypothetical protein